MTKKRNYTSKDKQSEEEGKSLLDVTSVAFSRAEQSPRSPSKGKKSVSFENYNSTYYYKPDPLSDEERFYSEIDEERMKQISTVQELMNAAENNRNVAFALAMGYAAVDYGFSHSQLKPRDYAVFASLINTDTHEALIQDENHPACAAYYLQKAKDLNHPTANKVINKLDPSGCLGPFKKQENFGVLDAETFREYKNICPNNELNDSKDRLSR